MHKFPYRFAKNFSLLVDMKSPKHVVVYHTSNPQPHALLEVQRYIDKPFTLEEIQPEQFNILLRQHYEPDSHSAINMLEDVEEQLNLQDVLETLPISQDLLEGQDDAPVIRMLNALFREAIGLGASDIHIETFADKVLVRFRIDGVLQSAIEIPRTLSALIISRIKVMAKLDIAEKRLPQDGRMSLHLAGHDVDVRVSTIPSSHGERVVLRILDKSVAHLNLVELGMDPDSHAYVNQLLALPHGMILVTGPTGSGKTTSLYAMLSELNNDQSNILTIEDPIEYDLPGIGQTQVSTKIDMTFARGLRAILRQDPDIVMVGEIRDLETAQIAVQASLTGHLVFSTLHTNTALGAVNRLRDMGVEPFLLSSSLSGLIAQRLVRVLCEDCKQERNPSDSEKKRLGLALDILIYDAKGCDACRDTGYRGRRGIYEIIVVDEILKKLIHDKADRQTLESHTRATFKSMRDNGYEYVKQGITTIEEVLRVTSDH